MTTVELPAKIERPPIGAPYLGMILFLVSEAFLFGSLFWSYYYLKVKTEVWPPEGVHLETGLVTANTVVLLLSAVTMQASVAAVKRGNIGRLRVMLTATVLLGALFIAIKGWEWVNESFRPWDHAYGSVYFTLTGFHGIHVLGGVLLLLALLVRTGRGMVNRERHLALEVAGVYWHFVDIVWLAVFASVFIIR